MTHNTVMRNRSYDGFEDTRGFVTTLYTNGYVLKAGWETLKQGLT